MSIQELLDVSKTSIAMQKIVHVRMSLPWKIPGMEQTVQCLLPHIHFVNGVYNRLKKTIL